MNALIKTNERGEIMTELEAIEWLKEEKGYHENFYKSCNPILGKQMREEAGAGIKAYKMAIAALEKQIPKRTVESDEYEYDEVCPICGHKPFTDDNYCANCGQALKIWEDEEE